MINRVKIGKKLPKIALTTLLLGTSIAGAFSVQADTLASYDFEDDTVMGWTATNESGKAERISGVSASTLGSEKVLQVDLALEDDGWADTYLTSNIDAGNSVDVSTVSSIDYTVYVPASFSGTLRLDCGVNNAWKASDTWATFDTSTTETLDNISYAKNTIQCALNGATSSTEAVLRIAAPNSPYTGPIYFDAVAITTTDGGGSEPTIEPRDPIVFDLEDSNHGWAVGWADSMTGHTISHSTDLTESGNTGSLKLELPFSGAGYEGVNLKKLLTDSETEKFDLNGYDRIEFDIFVPAASLPGSGGLNLVAAMDNNWLALGGAHYNALDGSAGELVMLNGVEYYRFHDVTSIPDDVNKNDSAALVVRIHGYQIPSPLTVYLDNIQLLPPDPGSIVPVAPIASTVVDSESLDVQVLIPFNTSQSITNAQVSSDFLDAPVELTGNGLLFSGSLAGIGNEDLGMHILTITATLNNDDNTTVDMSVEVPIYVDLSQTTITSQEDSHVITGNSTLSFAIASEDSTIDGAVFRLNSHEASATAMVDAGDGIYTLDFNSTELADGVHTLIIEATDANAYDHRHYVDVVVINTPVAGFVGRAGSDFYLNGNVYTYAGWNAYHLPFVRTETQFSSSDIAVINLPEDETGFQLISSGTTWSVSDRIDRSMLEAKRLGMKVLRTWAFNSRESEASTIGYGRVVVDETATEDFVEYEGVKYVWSFNEAQYARLDYVMESARRRGIRVILTLENYWGDYGGIQTTTDALGLEDKLEFYTNPAAQALYQLYAEKLINRVNTINGMAYRADPTLFAWELMNEPRIDCRDNAESDDDEACRTEGPIQLGTWFNTMAGYVKSIDTNHMVTTGAEAHGFTEEQYGTWPNGNNGPSDTEGYSLDPIGVMDQPNIDFFTYHPYFNESWAFYGFDQTAAINEAIVADAHAHGKPIVMEEWGFTTHEPLLDRSGHEVEPTEEGYQTLREEWYQFMLSNWREAGGNGHNIWMLQSNGQDSSFGISLYTPLSRALNDMTLSNILRTESAHYTVDTSDQGGPLDLKQLKVKMDALGRGWHMVGTSTPISDFSIFENVDSVWSWTNNRWSVYAPSASLQSNFQQSRLAPLTQISAHQGFWILKD